MSDDLLDRLTAVVRRLDWRGSEAELRNLLAESADVISRLLIDNMRLRLALAAACRDGWADGPAAEAAYLADVEPLPAVAAEPEATA